MTTAAAAVGVALAMTVGRVTKRKEPKWIATVATRIRAVVTLAVTVRAMAARTVTGNRPRWER